MPRYLNSLCWFRRDLRIADHQALYRALGDSAAVHCAFVFDTDILDRLPSRRDPRVEFIWDSLFELNERLQRLGGTLHVLHGRAQRLIPELARKLGVQAVYSNRDYEPAAIARDADVQAALGDIEFHQFKDQVIFERAEILTGSGTPYGVFTPYRNAWLKRLDAAALNACAGDFSRLAKCGAIPLPSLESLGFERCGSALLPAGESAAARLFDAFKPNLDRYDRDRDYPAQGGTSHLSVHLRFGTISIRSLASYAHRQGGAGAASWLSELIWRDFYQMLLWHHPRLAEGRAYKAQFEAIAFENDAAKFSAWCEGRTGYPLVDAAMRELNQTGYMHNRLRMVAASFLVKDLHVDWRWGERYFAERLLDFDLAANNGGWQWAASTGCDAQPWFRIFNPVTQSEKFDPDGRFIRRYLPELAACPDRLIHMPGDAVRGPDYPPPIVDHARARIRTLELFGAAARSGG